MPDHLGLSSQSLEAALRGLLGICDLSRSRIWRPLSRWLQSLWGNT
jgi:hypothetical protein